MVGLSFEGPLNQTCRLIIRHLAGCQSKRMGWCAAKQSACSTTGNHIQVEVKRAQKWATDRWAAWSGVNNGADFKHHPQFLSQGPIIHIHGTWLHFQLREGRKTLSCTSKRTVRSSLKIRGWESGWPPKKNKVAVPYCTAAVLPAHDTCAIASLQHPLAAWAPEPELPSTIGESRLVRTEARTGEMVHRETVLGRRAWWTDCLPHKVGGREPSPHSCPLNSTSLFWHVGTLKTLTYIIHRPP